MNESLDGFVTEGPLNGLPAGLARMVQAGILRIVGENENMCASGLHGRYVFRVNGASTRYRPRNYCAACGTEIFLTPGNLALAEKQADPRRDLFFRSNYGDDMGPV